MTTENSAHAFQVSQLPLCGRAPGKLILSGEHAVVYGAPAVVLSLPRHARAELSIQQTSNAPGLHIQLSDLASETFYSWETAQSLYQHCQLRHQQFLQHQLSITEVLPNAAALYVCGLMHGLAEWAPAVKLQHCQLQLSIHSQLSLGAGMGSSAATLAAALVALQALFGECLDRQRLQALVTEIECLQHGRSSGIDPAAAVYGGVLHFQPATETHNQQPGIATQSAISLTGWYYTDTGRPEVSTGQCTAEVKQRFADSCIWNEFADTTEALLGALKNRATADISAAVRRNHRLLCDIGVVPQPIQQLIARLEVQGASAKISGAGAVSGEGAGLVLVYSPDRLPQLPGLDFLPLQLDQAGACIETDMNSSHE